MRSKPLILPGYIVGLGCLFIMTYRTLLAFFSNSKSITVNINRFGEQHLDLIFLVIIWIITLIGLFYLFKYLKEEKISNQNTKREPYIREDNANLYLTKNFNFNEKTESQFAISIDTSKEIDSSSYLSIDGRNLLVSYESISLIEDDI